jgi:phage gp45-like
MIRTGQLIEESKDTGPHRLVRVAYDGDEKDAALIDFGGVVSAPLKGAQMLIIPADGDEGKLYAIALAPPKDRIDGNKPGENRIRQLKTGAQIEQTDGKKTNISDGDVVITSTSGTVHINPV